MRKSRFTAGQIIEVIKQAEAGIAVAELARQHGSSPASLYARRAKYGGTLRLRTPDLLRDFRAI